MAAKKRSGLGRGINALISTGEEKNPAETSAQKTLLNNTRANSKTAELKAGKSADNIASATPDSAEILVKIDEIEPNRNQPRKAFEDTSLKELADSIKEHGIIQPLTVTKDENGYRLVAGERRWRAARMAGLKEVPVVIRNYSGDEALEIALIENIQREDLNPMEEARAYQTLMDDFHLKQDEVARRVSKSRAAVANALRLLKLDTRVQQMLIDGMLSSGHARALLAIEEPDVQYMTAMKVFDDNLSVRETESLVKRLLSPKKKKPSQIDSLKVVYSDIEERLKSILGSKVKIKYGSQNKGKIEIDYYSADDLERLIALLSTIKNAY